MNSYEAFNRIEKVKSQVDQRMPVTFATLRDKLAKNKAAKLGDFHDREHLRNLVALRARL